MKNIMARQLAPRRSEHRCRRCKSNVLQLYPDGLCEKCHCLMRYAGWPPRHEPTQKPNGKMGMAIAAFDYDGDLHDY